MNTSFEFPKHFPVSGGKRVELRPPTAAEELELLTAAQAPGSAGTAAEVDIAKRCIVEFDGRPVKDIERDQVWEHELDGRARTWIRQWVGSCMGVGEAAPPFLAPLPG